MHARRRFLIAAAAVLACAPFVVPIFSPWSRINCREYEIDILSGRKRISRYLYGIPVQRRIEHTIISLQLPMLVSPGRTPRWQPVNTFGPYVRHSPHYIYHSATFQIRELGLIWDYHEFDTARRQSSARALLHEWQTTGSDTSADSYLIRLANEAEQDPPSPDIPPSD